jgi:UDP-N-acetylmuramoylalanine--D-glutamate ligase
MTKTTNLTNENRTNSLEATISCYLAPYKQILILGLGISGVASLEFFAQYGNLPIVAVDDSSAVLDKAKQAFALRIYRNSIMFTKFNGEIDYSLPTLVVASPGIPLYLPSPHPIIDLISCQPKSLITCDLAIFQQIFGKNIYIGITGTNGKSTTTALTDFVFNRLNIKTYSGGNIGNSCFELVNSSNYSDDANYVVEASSYQLSLMNYCRFNIASLSNITPDHLERHGGFVNYCQAKMNIFRQQTAKDFAIINIDNKTSANIYYNFKNHNFLAKTIAITTKESNKKILESANFAVAIFKETLYHNLDGDIKSISCSSEFLRGEHNDANLATTFAIIKSYRAIKNLSSQDHKTQQEEQNLRSDAISNISDQNIVENIVDFRGLSHRLQIVRTINFQDSKINFINDSKATNAESTEVALKSFDNIFWILGGVAKEGGISILEKYFHKIKKAYLVGESSKEFAKILLKNNVSFVFAETLDNAVKIAWHDLSAQQNVAERNLLLSPACASFDQWQNFEKRGEAFCDVIKNINI